jgi:exoribonuclease II
VKAILKVPVPGGSFRVYFDGTPTAASWQTLKDVIDKLARAQAFTMFLAGVNIGFDSEESMRRLQDHVAEKLLLKNRTDSTEVTVTEEESAK